MQVRSLGTRRFVPPRDDITEELARAFGQLTERSILVVTSKVVSIWEGHCRKVEDRSHKDRVIAESCEMYLPRDETPGRYVMHTITHGALMPSAGIDESNADEHMVFLPRSPRDSAFRIWQMATAATGLARVGVVVSDSRSAPLRRGSLGIAIGHAGFEATVDYRGRPDLFGRQLKVTTANAADAVAVAAVLVMGEGDEGTPFAVVEDLPPGITFLTGDDARAAPPVVALDDDLFRPFLTAVEWRQGGLGA